MLLFSVDVRLAPCSSKTLAAFVCPWRAEKPRGDTLGRELAIASSRMFREKLEILLRKRSGINIHKTGWDRKGSIRQRLTGLEIKMSVIVN